MALNIFGYPVATGGGTSFTAVAFYLVSKQDEFESQDGLRLLSVQNCCQSILTGCRAFSFFFPVFYHHLPLYNLSITILQSTKKKEKNYQKEVGKGP